MGRARKITTEDLIGLINSYHIDNPRIIIKIPNLGIYARNHGVDIADYLIRRDEKARCRIEELNSLSEEKRIQTVATYKTLDIDNFLKTNNTQHKLTAALSNLDSYYALIAESAGIIFKENEKLKHEIEDVRKKAKEDCLKAKNQNIREYQTKLKNMERTVKQLNDFIKKYIYPDIANALLEKEGLLSIVNEIVSPENIEPVVITTDTDISLFKNNEVNELLHKINK